MPVTVKLSRKFYDAFGEDVVNELVEWFNVIDATYHNDLRELNELNYDRLRAEMGQVRAESKTDISQLRAELKAEMAQLRAEFATFRAEMRRDMERLRADLIKWMFIFWATTALGVLGLTLRLR
jgi:ribosomal protein L29